MANRRVPPSIPTFLVVDTASNGQAQWASTSAERDGTLATAAGKQFYAISITGSRLNSNISYSGSYKPNGNSLLSVYGWTRNPLIEYYIIESYGSYNPGSAGVKKGTVSCDGGEYDIVTFTRNNQPSIDGIRTFPSFWSVRSSRKNPGGAISGNVSTACHFDAWKKYGMNLGSEHNYQIVATEAYYSSGSSQITVSG